MRRVRFQAHGHENVIGEHSTTLEITTETSLTKRGTCIIGVEANQTLNALDNELKSLASKDTTRLVLRMTVGDFKEVVTGWGSPGLTYSDSTSMVVRTSSFECGRTLMVQADKAASDLPRTFVDKLKIPDTVLECELTFFSEV
jgi:hypothetical protein